MTMKAGAQARDLPEFTAHWRHRVALSGRGSRGSIALVPFSAGKAWTATNSVSDFRRTVATRHQSGVPPAPTAVSLHVFHTAACPGS